MNFYGKKLGLPMYAMVALIGCNISAHADPIDADKAKVSREELKSQKVEKGTLTDKQKDQLEIDEDNVMNPFPG